MDQDQKRRHFYKPICGCMSFSLSLSLSIYTHIHVRCLSVYVYIYIHIYIYLSIYFYVNLIVYIHIYIIMYTYSLLLRYTYQYCSGSAKMLHSIHSFQPFLSLCGGERPWPSPRRPKIVENGAPKVMFVGFVHPWTNQWFGGNLWGILSRFKVPHAHIHQLVGYISKQVLRIGAKNI